MSRAWWIWCVVLGCGGARTSQTPPHAATPAVQDTVPGEVERGDVGVLDKREVPPLPKQSVVAAGLTATVEAASAPKVEATSGSTHVALPLGGHIGTVDCYVYPSEINPGAQLMGVVKAMGSAKNVTLAAVEPTDAVVADEHVVLFVDAAYRVKRPEGDLVDLVKLAVYAHPTTPFVCLHDQVGYHQTFKRVVTGLAASLKRAGAEAPASRYVSIDVMKVQGHASGFNRVDVSDGEGGTKIYRSEGTTILPRSATDLMVSDSARVEVWERSGFVKTISYASLEGDETSEQIVLKRTGVHTYAYEGTHAGKKVSGTLATKGPLGFEGDALQDAALNRLLTTGGELHSEGYHPDVDPTQPIDTVFRVVSKTDRIVTMNLGKIELRGNVDDHGRMVTGEATIGPVTFATERLLVRGSY